MNARASAGPAVEPLRSLRDEERGAASTIGPLGSATVAISLAFLAAALAWPQATEGLLRLFFVTLAAAVVVDRVLRGVLPVRASEALHSPFDRDAGPWTPPSAPRRLRELAVQLSAANDPRAADRHPIHWSVRDTLRDEARRRLAERHSLALHDPEHHASIRALVSVPTWELIRPDAAAPRSGPATASARPRVPVGRLRVILDDLESL